MARSTTPERYEMPCSENLNAVQLQKADEIWHQTVDSVRNRPSFSHHADPQLK